MATVSLVFHQHSSVCIFESVCARSVHFLLKGGPRGLRLWVRNDRDDSWITAPSFSLSISRPSFPPSSVYWQVCSHSTPHKMNHNDPARIRNHYLHSTNVHCEYKSPAVGVTDHLKHRYMLKSECQISPQCTLVCHSSVSLRENRKIHAQWSSWIMSMNVNYRDHMCIHHSHTLICQKIRPCSEGRVPVSDMCAKLLSFIHSISYPNNIKSVGYTYMLQIPRGDWHISLDCLHCISICHVDSKHIISSRFPCSRVWLDTSRSINFS